MSLVKLKIAGLSMHTTKINLGKNSHANLDSLPYRYGITYEDSVDIEIISNKPPRKNKTQGRFQVDGYYTCPLSGNKIDGKFVYGSSGSSAPFIVTVMDNIKCSTDLSTAVKEYRLAGRITVDDIKGSLHKQHMDGSIRTHVHLHDAIDALKGRSPNSDVEIQKAHNKDKLIGTRVPEDNPGEEYGEFPGILEDVKMEIWYGKDTICLYFKNEKYPRKCNFNTDGNIFERQAAYSNFKGEEVKTTVWNSKEEPGKYKGIGERAWFNNVKLIGD
jgi:hypothetical protein